MGQRQQHFSMFRALLCAAKEFHFLFTLFCTISILVTCNGCSVNEVQSALSGFEPSNVNSVTGFQFVFDGHVSSELVVPHYVQQRFVVTLDYQANEPYSNNTQFYQCSSSAVTSMYCVRFTSNPGISLAKSRPRTSFGGFLIDAKGFAVKSTCLAKPLFCFGVCSSGVWRKNSSFLNPLNGTTLCAVGVIASSSAFSGNAREKEELVPKHGKFHFSTSAVSVLEANKPVELGHYCFQWISVKSTSPEQLLAQLIPNSGSEQVSFKVFIVTMIWKSVRKMLMFLLTSALLYLLVSPLFPRLTAFKPEDFRNRKNSFLPAIRALDSSHMHSNLLISFTMSSKVMFGEEMLLLKSIDGHCFNPRLAYCRQTDSLLKLVWVENSDMQKESNSENLNVKVGKEKKRSRRKKKSVEVSSSLSSNSPACSSLSPVASRKPLAQENDWQYIESKCYKHFSKVNTFGHEVIFKHKNQNMHYSAQKRPNLTKKVNEKAVLSPSTCHYPVLASNSKLSLHARAPGRTIRNRGNVEYEAKMDFKEKFTYDIWGDHLFGPRPTYKSKIISNNSKSFFVRDLQIMKDSMLKPVSCDMRSHE